MKAKVGTRDARSLSNTAWPIRAMANGLLAVDDLGERGEVGARRQYERLSCDRDRHNVLAGVRSVESPVQFAEPSRAQGVGSGVITPVIQSDQHRRPG